VRLPRERANRAFRCPQCKQGIPLTSKARPLPVAPLGAAAAGVNCPICQSGLDATDPAVQCPACDQLHHSECWAEIGGCGTYGCAEAPELKKEEADTAGTRAGWGDTKTCPACGQKIKAVALRCPKCRARFDTVDPMTSQEYRNRKSRTQKADTLRKAMVGLFVASVIGVFFPITLIVGAILILPNREALNAAGPIYKVLGYAALGLSTLWALGFVIALVAQMG
jgi:hypothetical protein